MLPAAVCGKPIFNSCLLKCKQGGASTFVLALAGHCWPGYHHCRDKDSPPLAALFAGSARPILLLSRGVCCGVVVVILFIRGRQGSGC